MAWVLCTYVGRSVAPCHAAFINSLVYVPRRRSAPARRQADLPEGAGGGGRAGRLPHLGGRHAAAARRGVRAWGRQPPGVR